MDPGPWLTFIMPVTFVLTLLLVCWFANTSF